LNTTKGPPPEEGVKNGGKGVFIQKRGKEEIDGGTPTIQAWPKKLVKNPFYSSQTFVGMNQIRGYKEKTNSRGTPEAPKSQIAQ